MNFATSSLCNFAGSWGCAHTRVMFRLRPQELGHVPRSDIVGSCVAESWQAKIYHTTWTQFIARLSSQINRENASLVTDVSFVFDDTFSSSWKWLFLYGSWYILSLQQTKYQGHSSLLVYGSPSSCELTTPCLVFPTSMRTRFLQVKADSGMAWPCRHYRTNHWW